MDTTEKLLSSGERLKSYRRYKQVQRKKLGTKALELRNGGFTWKSISLQLGPSVESLRKWSKLSSSRSVCSNEKFIKVEVEDVPVSVAQSSNLRQTTPKVFLIEGLDIEGISCLLRQLQC